MPVPVLLCIISGVVYSAAFPPADMGFFAWFVFIPFFFACDGKSRNQKLLLGHQVYRRISGLEFFRGDSFGGFFRAVYGAVGAGCRGEERLCRDCGCFAFMAWNKNTLVCSLVPSLCESGVLSRSASDLFNHGSVFSDFSDNIRESFCLQSFRAGIPLRAQACPAPTRGGKLERRHICCWFFRLYRRLFLSR